MSDSTEIHLLDHKVRLLQVTDGFRSSLDSVFLAAVCPAGKGQTILDLGCGVGGAGFCLLWRVPETRLTGVELQADHADLARQNIALNGMEGRVEIVNADIRDFRSVERFDHVICNPPYLEAGTYTPSPQEKKAAALGHHGTDVSLDDWLEAAFYNLKSGGSFTIIHRADMTDKIIQGLGRRYGDIEIIPLWPHQGEEAKRVIIRAVKDRKSPAHLHPGIVLHTAEGDYTDESYSILREGTGL